MELLKRATSFCRVNKILHGFQGERSPAIKISMMFPQYYRSKISKGYLNKGPRWDYNTNDMKNSYTYATSTISLVWLARKSTTNHRRDIRTAPFSFFYFSFFSFCIFLSFF